MRILLVEDEKKLAKALEFSLTKEGYVVDTAFDGITGLDLALSDIYDVVILDRMLPGMDGIDILHNMRYKKIITPVLILTAKDTIEDRVLGLDTGADDYLVKPFATKELLARIRALGRRRQEIFVDEHIEIGKLIFNPANCKITCSETVISLTFKETQIFEILACNKNRIISRDRLQEKVWGYESNIESNNLEAYLSYLRKKLSKIDSGIIIETVRGVGYLLKEVE